jgi:hypothetical protein
MYLKRSIDPQAAELFTVSRSPRPNEENMTRTDVLVPNKTGSDKVEHSYKTFAFISVCQNHERYLSRLRVIKNVNSSGFSSDAVLISTEIICNEATHDVSTPLR